MKRILRIIALSLIPMMMFSCGDPEENNGDGDVQYTNGFLVLCEGLMGHNDAGLDFYSLDSMSLYKDVFSSVNGQGLGDVANDMVYAGDKIFIAVTNSAAIMIMDRSSLKLQKIISLAEYNDGVNPQPRSFCVDGDDVYVSTFAAKIFRISASEMTVKDVFATGGRNPEQMAIVGGKLYIANSGGLSFPNYDNTVSVINLSTLKVEKNIEVHPNPTQIKAYNNTLYVLSMGNYSTKPMMTEIKNDAVTDSAYISVSSFLFYGSNMYYMYQDITTNAFVIGKKPAGGDIRTEGTDFSQIPSTMKTPYSLSVADGKLIVTDAKNYTVSGEVFVFSLDGEFLYSFSSGIIPSKVLKK